MPAVPHSENCRLLAFHLCQVQLPRVLPAILFFCFGLSGCLFLSTPCRSRALLMLSREEGLSAWKTDSGSPRERQLRLMLERGAQNADRLSPSTPCPKTKESLSPRGRKVWGDRMVPIAVGMELPVGVQVCIGLRLRLFWSKQH